MLLGKWVKYTQKFLFIYAQLKDRIVIFGSRVWFSGMANLMESFNFTPRPFLVATATKFETKWAITRLV